MSVQVYPDLHSTMFLLILRNMLYTGTQDLNLHSTMFLLILNQQTGRMPNRLFTFHDVSINTLLNLIKLLLRNPFTFHDVSINTHIHNCPYHHICTFTFHDVSINTLSEPICLSSINIYIPRCFY